MRGRGLSVNKPDKTSDGYTLFSPLETKNAYLIDMQGNFVHRWELLYQPGDYGYPLENGNLIISGRTDKGPATFGGRGGMITEYDWEGNAVWQYEEPTMHHDFTRMPNGNTMVLGWERTPLEISDRVKGGKPGSGDGGGLWCDYFREVTPSGDTVWEWHGYDHLDPELDSICPIHNRDEWTHCNTCNVLPDGNILTSFRLLDTVGIVDKATGKFNWKWGKDVLGHQHDPTLLDDGSILIFDNGWHAITASTPSSRVIEVEPSSGEIKWEYKARPGWDFFSAFISGAQRQPNGNTLVCEGMIGRIFEITREGENVWDYNNPFYGYDDRFGYANRVFRAYRYSADFPGFRDKEFRPGKLAWLSNLYR